MMSLKNDTSCKSVVGSFTTVLITLNCTGQVYGVGTYMDSLAMSVIKSQGEKEVKKALLDPNYPRVSLS